MSRETRLDGARSTANPPRLLRAHRMLTVRALRALGMALVAYPGTEDNGQRLHT